jgi:hypothetical protein
MRTKTLAATLALVLFTGGLAGCIGDDDAEQQNSDAAGDLGTNETDTNETDVDEDPGPTLTKTWFNGSIEGGAAGTGYYCSPAGPCDNSMEFEVPNGTQTVLVEAAWEADASAFLDVGGECQQTSAGRTCETRDSTSGGSPLAVTFDSPEVTGTWGAVIWVDEDQPTQIEPTIVATVVEDGQLPNGYSAFDGSGN